MKRFALLFLVVFSCALSAYAQENKFIQMWIEQNKPVILVKEIDDVEWRMNQPYFYRDGFSSDGATRLTIARVENSTDPAYKRGSLILFERRCEREEQLNNLPYWLIFISAQTPAIALTEDGTAFYVYGEDTYYFNAEELKKLTLPSGSIWEQMKSALP